MLEEDVYRDIKSRTRLWVKGDALGNAHCKGLLMGGFAEDKTLPVDPSVKVVARLVDKYLETHLWVLREVNLSIHQGFHDTMVSTTVDCTKNKVHTSQLSLRPQQRQQVGTALILVALPSGDVVIGKARVLIRAIEDEGMETSFDANGIEGLVGDTRPYPEAWQRVTCDMVGIELIVLEESECISIKGQRTSVVGREVVVISCQPFSSGTG